ncbi:MAG: DUF1365 family protein [Hyphomicrobiales bacterium]|nr:DUF1365 family protein [Hyphomicrobiales bacterium]MDE2113966.1 DUF1365 domain-containing protein [Hyphomicrobiales bacterium]
MNALSAPLAAHAPFPAASLYSGEVMHARLKPMKHKFVYRVFSLLIDVARLPEAGRASRLFSVGRFNLLSFHPRDHAGHKDVPLLVQVQEMLAPAKVVPDQVLLLCYPRVLGFVFNPLSVYYCLKAGQPVAIIHEVRNTFGESHSYILPIQPDQMTAEGIQQTCAKRFYVSPFMDMDLFYRFFLTLPGESLIVRIIETSGALPIFIATFHAARQELSSLNVLKAFFGLPLMTGKVVAAIYFEALKLWLKGMRLQPRPKAPLSNSLELDGNE